MKNRNWTREETILALELYFKTPFGKMDQTNPDVIALSQIIGRTPSSVTFKLVNLASLDQSISQKGMSNTSKLDRLIWNEFCNDLGKLVEELEKTKKAFNSYDYDKQESPNELENYETDRIATIKARKGQDLFRSAILASYSFTCCLTGIAIPQLLVASHISPWATDKENRLNPHNGLCLNLLHDKAFDSFLITFDNQFRTIVSDKIKNSNKNSELDFILRTEGKQIRFPKKFKPSLEFIRMHQKKYEIINC